MNETDLRDCFAMFAMVGLMISGVDWKAEYAYEIADQMVEARKKEKDDGEELGIAAVRTKRKYPKRPSDL